MTNTTVANEDETDSRLSSMKRFRGYSTELEKPYLRLTSAPKSSAVRPLKILRWQNTVDQKLWNEVCSKFCAVEVVINNHMKYFFNLSDKLLNLWRPGTWRIPIIPTLASSWKVFVRYNSDSFPFFFFFFYYLHSFFRETHYLLEHHWSCEYNLRIQECFASIWTVCKRVHLFITEYPLWKYENTINIEDQAQNRAYLCFCACVCVCSYLSLCVCVCVCACMIWEAWLHTTKT